MSIADIFARHGEADFRSGEARVIARLLESGPQVLATGGGAFMNPGYPRGDQGEGRLGLAQRRIRRADAAHQQAQERAADCCRPPIRPRRSRNCWPRAIRSMRRPISRCSRAKCRMKRSWRKSSRRLPFISALAPPQQGMAHDRAVRDDPTIVNVALGARSYDIVIGRGLLASLGARIAALRPGAKAVIVTDDECRSLHLPGRSRAGAGRRRVEPRHRCGRRSLEELPRARAVCEAIIASRHRARRSRDCARRRRHRRSRGFRRRGGAPRCSTMCRCRRRCWRTSIPRSAARPPSIPATARIDWRIPSAGAGCRRHRTARHAAAARVPRRLRRGREIRPARRCGILRLA